MSTYTEEADCLDAGGATACRGPVEYRAAISGTGRSFPRCDRHWERRLAEHEEISAAYPDSPIAPSWFDPTLAGERWDDDY